MIHEINALKTFLRVKWILFETVKIQFAYIRESQMRVKYFKNFHFMVWMKNHYSVSKRFHDYGFSYGASGHRPGLYDIDRVSFRVTLSHAKNLVSPCTTKLYYLIFFDT